MLPLSRLSVMSSRRAFSSALSKALQMTTRSDLKDYTSFFTERSARRQPSAIRSLAPLMALPGMISLGGGNPHPSTFPFVGMSFTLRNGEVITVSEEDAALGLQYSPTNGLPGLVSWLKDLQTTEHKPPCGADFDICVGNGSQDVLTKAFDMLLDGNSTLLCEAPAYVGSLAFLRPIGCKFAEIPSDSDGLNPDALEATLSSWSETQGPRPRVLYSVPIGGNPTGCSTTLARKKHIYEIACKYDILILEDDPYYYLQFADTRTPSYFSMDTQQRVLRFDSFSKILSAGVRVGWVTGPKPLVERIVLHSQASILHASGMSQLMVMKLLQKWGIQGFLEHTVGVSQFYKEKGAFFLECASRHLKGLAEWVEPNAGMFVWIKLNGIRDSSSLIKTKAMEKKVLMVPGFEFFPNPRETPYVRASFSTATKEQIEEACVRLAELIREEQ
ncbi:pyridoxal phosphate-dependent transferase [Chytriomyces sp. MP71]|nr:pyridoxal phosphate-dependent transferase [Chytriomyces sp. MP71]